MKAVTKINKSNSRYAHPDILVIALKYHKDKNNPYLTNNLISCLRERGLSIDVIALGDVDHQGFVQSKSGKEYFAALSSKKRFSKYIGMLKVTIDVIQAARKFNMSADKVLFFAPLSLYLPLFSYFLGRSKSSVCIVFDIYPRHQCELKAIPKILLRPLRWLETVLINKCDIITAMSPANKSAIMREYGVPANRVALLPLWVPSFKLENRKVESEVENNNSRFRKSVFDPGNSNVSEKIKVVFGGQLTFGRSLQYAIEFLELLREDGLDISLSIFSAGYTFEKEAKLNSRDWVNYLPRLNAEEYRHSLAQFDIGLAVTDERVSLPTFPSKIPEYLLAGVRSLCFLEANNDVDAVIPQRSWIHVNRFSTSKESIALARAFCEAARIPMTVEEVDAVEAQFSVENAADRVLEIFSNNS